MILLTKTCYSSNITTANKVCYSYYRFSNQMFLSLFFWLIELEIVKHKSNMLLGAFYTQYLNNDYRKKRLYEIRTCMGVAELRSHKMKEPSVCAVATHSPC